MEIIHSTGSFSWDHEASQAFRIAPPDLVPTLDEGGNVVLDENGQPVLSPPAGWIPEKEQVEIDTVIVIDRSSQELINVYKLSFAKEDLANFLAYYVEHLDVSGRVIVREALEQSSGIIRPNLDALSLVPS